MKRGENLLKHGLTGSPEHRIWLGMMTRCHWNDPSRDDFHLYQGKGIQVCQRWQDFKNFLYDMGRRPSAGSTIERLNSDGNYEPDNCVWATRQAQARNTTRNRLLAHDNRIQPLVGWAEETGIPRETIADRLKRGWLISAALTTPVIRQRQRDPKGHFV